MILIASAASLQAMAAVRADITIELSQELRRTSWLRGAGPLRSARDVSEEAEEPYAVHPFWELCALAVNSGVKA